MRILLPISLDRWKNPISALLRSCVQYNPEVEFHSFSKPVSAEDHEQGESFWRLPNLVKSTPGTIFRHHYDIVHTASYSDMNYLSSVASKLRGMGRTRFLNTMNLEPDPENPIAWTRYRRLLRMVDGFVAVSQAVAKDFHRSAPSRFLGVIPNGFDPEFYDPAQTDPSLLPTEIRDIGKGFPLWVAGLEKRKHPEVLIQLAKRNPDVQFVALGGVVPNDGEVFAEEFKRVPNIHWLGSVDRVIARTILAFSGVLVFPSEREGLSLAMIEALGMGVPIIAQPKSSMPELVEVGVNGSLVDIDDSDGWNEALIRYLGLSEAERLEIFKKVRKGAVERFSWSHVGASYGPVYRELITRKVSWLHPLQAV
jgi:glycosyltransferase involved in cell wall biosynthesis